MQDGVGVDRHDDLGVGVVKRQGLRLALAGVVGHSEHLAAGQPGEQVAGDVVGVAMLATVVDDPDLRERVGLVQQRPNAGGDCGRILVVGRYYRGDGEVGGGGAGGPVGGGQRELGDEVADRGRPVDPKEDRRGAGEATRR